MPPRKNAKRGDWLWVELMRQANQGKRIEFRFHGQICDDKKINKNVARNVTSIDIIEARKHGMPETPEGWEAIIHSAIDENPENREASDRETSNSVESTTTMVQQFGIRNLAYEQYVLYDFLRGKGYALSKSLSMNIDAFMRYTLPDESSTDVLRAALLLACKAGSDQAVDTLLSRGVSPNSRDNNGNPCLMIASWYNHESVVYCLIEAGADVVLTDTLGRTSWDYIHSSSEHESIASVLWQKGRKHYNQKVLEAAAAGDVGKIQSAIEHGADPSYTLEDERLWSSHAATSGWTPLHHAAFNGHLEAARVLIKAGAKLNMTSYWGMTPLETICDSLLVPKRPFVSKPLESSIIELLITNGAKDTRIDTTGKRILDEEDFRKGTNQVEQHVLDKQDNREAADVSPSPMSWQYTALGAPEVLKESPYKLSRILGFGTHSAAISIDGSSYRPSVPGQASNSLRAIMAKNNQGSHKSWATPPMRSPAL